MKRILTFILTIIVAIFTAGNVLAQALSERLTQEEFAVELVKNLKLEGVLPTAALPGDCVNLLERLGVAPLTGWKNKSFLSREDYLVIIAKTQGKEAMVHDRAAAVEEKNTEIIDKKWQKSYQKNGRWLSLKEILDDRDYFPDGPPASPYGFKYQDLDGDHKVDRQHPAVLTLIRWRELFSGR